MTHTDINKNAENLPLEGVRVIELAGLGPVPYAGQLLADMGAEVIAISRAGQPSMPIEDRGKRSVQLNLKQPEAVDAVLKLIGTADILTEGYRPGVTERLGLGPDHCLKVNPALVYARMTGWGQTGPWSQMAGHDINYIGLTGVLHAIGQADQVPVPPLNLIGDYGGGSLFLVSGVLAALYAAQKTGKGDVVDVAMVDGALSMFGLMLSMDSQQQWSTQRSANLLDGGMPYYRCYRCRDDRFFAVGALEPAFFKELLQRLNIDSADYGGQHDSKRFAAQQQLLAARFLEKTRDEWSLVFDGSDACATPVLDYREAQQHPHMKARNSLTRSNNVWHPHAAPRFAAINRDSLDKGQNPSEDASARPPQAATFAPAATPERGQDTAALLDELELPAHAKRLLLDG